MQKLVNEFLKSARTSLGLSGREVCERTGLSIYQYSDLELRSDEFFDTISVADARKVCQALEVDLKCLIPRGEHRIANTAGSHSGSEVVTKTREGLGLSIEQVADRIGFETATVALVEEDEKNIEALNLSTVLSLAEVLEIDPCELT